MNAFAAYATVAAVCAGSSILVALIGYKSFHQISDMGMWAITVATSAPMLGGFGIAYFINESQRSQDRRDRAPPLSEDDVPPGSFKSER